MTFFSCKEQPNYNPFDNQINISTDKLAEDGIDTISAGCGYFNLTQKKKNFRTYYQVFNDDYDSVLAKGFSYIIDTMALYQGKPNLYRTRDLDSVCKLPFDQSLFNMEIGNFGYKVLSQNDNIVYIVNSRMDTIPLSINYFHSEGEDVIRSFDFYKQVR